MASALAPKVSLVINGFPLKSSIVDFVQSVTVEQSHDKATLISLSIANPIIDRQGQPRSSALLWTDSMAFRPGNVVEAYMGYGAGDLEFVGAGIIRKWQPRFTRGQMPTLELKCLDALSEMMDGNDKVQANKARKFERSVSLIDITVQIFNEYGFNTRNVDTATPTPTLSVPAQKKSGTSDYQFVRGIANTIGWDFYIEWDYIAAQWLVHLHPPVSTRDEKKTFTWGPDYAMNGRVGGLLLDFSPEFALQGHSTDVEVFYYDRGSSSWERVIWPQTKSSKKKTAGYKGDDTTMTSDLQAAGSAEGGRGLSIQAGGVKVEVVPAHGFRSAEEAVTFAKSWWQARQDMLIAGPGAIPGYPALRPGQVHEFLGLGDGLSGEWYIAEVTHRFRAGAGYETGFQARRVIP